MICAGCGFAAPTDFAFCPHCGSKLIARCPACGAPGPPDFAFCPRCGARLSAPAGVDDAGSRATRGDADGAADSDRRPVTVVFADLAGFTTLGERLDPEDVRALQNEMFTEMSSAIRRYDGLVEKFVGDAVVGLFGAPIAHEDDPERALRATLLMQERIAVLNHRWDRRLGRPLALHIGVSTGRVVAGTLAASAGGAYAVTGDAVNTAARLQSATEPGQILVSRATFDLTKHLFAFESLGALTVKGKAEAVAVHRLLGTLDRPRSARGLETYGLRAPLIGREDELDQILAAFDRMLRGRAQVVSLIGEAGTGKSRLQAEFLARLEAAGHLETTAVRRAACSSLGEKTYGVLAALLREGYGVAPDDPLATARRKLESGLEALGMDAVETARMAALLGSVLGLEMVDPHTQHLEPEQRKRQIFLAGRALVERRLEQQPVLLVVEDLHWADAASLELLRFIVDRLADRRLMLLLAYRPLVDTAALAPARVTHLAIRLEPLSVEQSAALLSAYFGASRSRLPARLQSLIVERAGGNPFYLEELVRSLIADGVLVREDDDWRCATEAAQVQVPVTLQALLLSRVDRLRPVPHRLIQEAAVIGSAFDLRLLRMVAGAAGDTDAALDQLVGAEFLTEVPQPAGGPRARDEARYRFTHALVQDAVYQSLLVRRRTELHTRVGEALETLHGPQPQRLEDMVTLGHHWSLSSDKPRGARYLLTAGDWARAIYANADAARQYQRALETLTECDSCETDRCPVRERLGDLLGSTGWREGALQHYQAALAGYERSGDDSARARVLRKMGRLHWDAGERERAQGCLEAGLALTRATPDDIELAHLYQEMGRLAFRSGDSHRAVQWAERALAQAERLASTEGQTHEASAAMAQAYNTLGVALARLGRPDEAVGHIERSVAVAEREGLHQAACRGFANLGVLYSTLDPRRAIETCSRGLETAKKIGDLGFQSRLYANLAVAYCALTNRCDDEGIGAARAAIDLDRRLGQLDHLAVPLIVLGQIYQCHGQPERALEHYREAMGLAEEMGEPQLLFPCYEGLATLYFEIGDEAQGEEYLAKAQQVCERARVEPDALVVLPFLD